VTGLPCDPPAVDVSFLARLLSFVAGATPLPLMTDALKLARRSGLQFLRYLISYLILSYLILSYLILSYLILSKLSCRRDAAAAADDGRAHTGQAQRPRCLQRPRPAAESGVHEGAVFHEDSVSHFSLRPSKRGHDVFDSLDLLQNQD